MTESAEVVAARAVLREAEAALEAAKAAVEQAMEGRWQALARVSAAQRALDLALPRVAVIRDGVRREACVTRRTSATIWTRVIGHHTEDQFRRNPRTGRWEVFGRQRGRAHLDRESVAALGDP